MSTNDERGINRAELLRRGAAGAVGIGVLGAIGCGDDDDGGSTGASTTPESTPPSTPTGVLRLGMITGGAKTLADPREPLLGAPGEARKQMVQDSLTYTVFGKSEMRLAEAIESTDATVWDVTLREGIEFSDGRPLRPEDIISSVKLFQGKTSGLAPVWGGVEVEKTGPRNVRFTLAAPNSMFAENQCRQLWPVPEDYDPKKPIGVGPFKIDSAELGRKTVMSPNPNYWGDDGPYVETLEIYEFNDDTARFNALVSGQIDAIDTVPAAQVQTIKNNPDLIVLTPSGNGYGPILMDTQTAPMDDERVRQAMRLIVDRNGMLEQVQAGLGAIGNDVFAPNDPAVKIANLPQREQDIEQAKSLLQAAGKADFTVELVTGPIGAGAIETAQAFAEQAKAAGVTVKIKQVDAAQYFTPEAGYGTNPFFMSFGGGTFYLSYAAITIAPEATFPETKWQDPEWGQIYTEALATSDPAKRNELVAQLMTIDYERGGHIIPMFGTSSTAASKKVKGLRDEPGSNFGLNDYSLQGLWVEA